MASQTVSPDGINRPETDDKGQNEPFMLTKAGYDAIQQELAALKERYQEDRANYADVNYSNDPTPEEASEFETKVTKERDEERISHLELVLRDAVVIEEDPDPSTIDPGDRVTLRNLKDRTDETFDLIGANEVLAGRRGITLDSPVGKAIYKRRKGDIVDVETPDGKVRYAIRKIERSA